MIIFFIDINYLICPNERLSERLLEDSGSQANFVQKPISAGALQESALFGYQAQKPKSATPLFLDELEHFFYFHKHNRDGSILQWVIVAEECKGSK